MPEIKHLVGSNWRDFNDAYELALQAEKYIPKDPELTDLFLWHFMNIPVLCDWQK